MTKYSELMQSFLDSQNAAVSETLTKSVIEQMGGEQNFIENYDHVAMNGHNGLDGIDAGFSKTEDLVSFHNENSTEIKETLAQLAEEIGLNSGMDLINTHSKLKERYDINLDDIADAIFGELLVSNESDIVRDKILTWTGLAVGYEVCLNYHSFINDEG